MIVRTIAFLVVIAAITHGAFRLLVEGEVQRVVSVHVIDKAEHLVDMLEHNSNEVFDQATHSVSPVFIDMARASHIAAVVLYDASGREMRHIKTTAPVAPADAHSHQMPADHAAHDHGPAPRMAQGHAHGDGAAAQDEASPGGHPHHGHGADHGDAALTRLLSAVAPPEAAEMQPLLTGQREAFVRVDSLDQALEGPLHYAQVVLPVFGPEGRRIGYAGFVLSVSHIYSAYAQGVWAFGTLFMICGAVLFGVPAFGFWLQKKFAEKSSRAAKYLSRHDALTGLLNRSAFVTEGSRLVASDAVSHVAYLDADRFKLINDTYGHKIGDAFLCHLAELLRAICGEDALIARLGGDEFSFALPKDRQIDLASLLDEVLARAAKEVAFDGISFSATISIGVAAPKPGDDLDAVLQRADTALYHVKSNGRNSAAVYTDEMGAAADRRRSLEARLREASRQGDFSLAFQPLIDAKTSAVTGYEALLRLKDRDGVPVPPSEFIPLAEEIGLIEDIGTWVLQNATQQIKTLEDDCSVSVNLSADQFRSGRLCEIVRGALDAAQLPPERLELEITESILLDRETETKFQIDALKEMGVSIAMDDFGTGFSSLSTLWKYGFDRLKIDKSFVHALEDTPERSAQLIDAIVIMSERMGMRITAEGIETEAQRQVLVDLGCDVLQGFFFGRPAPLPQSDDARTRQSSA